MFSGIVESCQKVVAANPEQGLVRLKVARPPEFTDLKTGDSICVDGICLTLEKFNATEMQFALGAETLAITCWSAGILLNKVVNLERSLKIGDRVHGHMVSGHVDAVGTVHAVSEEQGSLLLEVRTPEVLKEFLWKKGSCAVNGVSLTLNEVVHDIIKLCLIPETRTRTNLGAAVVGAKVNLEVDMWARGMVHALRAREGERA